MRQILIPALVAGALFSYSCAPKATKSSRKPAFSEDLSVYRPKYEPARETDAADEKPQANRTEDYPEPVNDATAEINVLLDTIAERNKKVNYVQGYTILVRGGQKDEAIEIRQRIMNLFPETNPQLEWDHPSYKIKVGKFYSKYEANKLYAQIKREFPNRVILAPEVIKLN